MRVKIDHLTKVIYFLYEREIKTINLFTYRLNQSAITIEGRDKQDETFEITIFDEDMEKQPSISLTKRKTL